MRCNKSAFAILVLGLAVSLGSAQQAQAQFLGDTVNGTYYFPNQSSAYSNQGNKVVNPSASFTFPTGFPNVTATVSDSSIVATFDDNGIYNPATFSGFVITDVSRNPMLSGVTAFSTIAGFDMSRVQFTSTSVSVNLQGLNIARTDTITVNVQNAAVPEPGSLALLAGMGLSGAGFLARRRKNARQAA